MNPTLRRIIKAPGCFGNGAPAGVKAPGHFVTGPAAESKRLAALKRPPAESKHLAVS